eukprot:1183419-Pleurochrysis_carterae.AAC.1
MPAFPHVSLWKRSVVCTPPSRSMSDEFRSIWKSSRCDVLSNESEMAPAFVPEAMRWACAGDAPHATVDERETLATRGMAARPLS